MVQIYAILLRIAAASLLVALYALLYQALKEATIRPAVFWRSIWSLPVILSIRDILVCCVGSCTQIIHFIMSAGYFGTDGDGASFTGLGNLPIPMSWHWVFDPNPWLSSSLYHSGRFDDTRYDYIQLFGGSVRHF